MKRHKEGEGFCTRNPAEDDITYRYSAWFTKRLNANPFLGPG